MSEYRRTRKRRNVLLCGAARRAAPIGMVVTGLVGTAIGMPGPASAADLQTVNYGVVGISACTLPLLVAEANGYFADHGLKVNLIDVGQSQPICEQLIAGALNLGECSMTDTIQAITKGGSIEMVDNEDSTALPYDLVTKKGITTWAQLKGQTIMLGGPRDNTVYFFSLLAKKAGYTLKDFSFTYAGASSARYAALQSGSIGGTLLTLPYNDQAEGAGFPKLASTGTVLTPSTYAGGGTDVNKSYATSHASTIRDYLAAYKQATAWIYNPANKAAAMKIMETKADTSSAAAQETYQTLVKGKYWEQDPTIDVAGVSGAQKSLYSIGFLTGSPVPVTSIFTTTFTR